MEADAEGGGGGAEGGFRPSATFADWPDDDAEGEVAPRHQLRIGPSGAGSSAGPAKTGIARAVHRDRTKRTRNSFFFMVLRSLPIIEEDFPTYNIP